LNNANKSRKIQLALTLDLANQFKDFEKIYFTYKIDFRGRLYPVQQMLNPQGSAIIKSLLEFSEGQVPTERGIYWLKIALANAYGKSKLSFKEREAWTDENIEDIKAFAENPYDALFFVEEADEPFVFLSLAQALNDGLQGKEVNVPVGLDASCSGIQIYAGLMLDEKAAKSVNVINNEEDKPADVYDLVAKKVVSYLVAGDYPKIFSFTTRDGIKKEVSTEIEANSLIKTLNRSHVKRNVMTLPYSVSERGMYNQLKEIFKVAKDDNIPFWKGEEFIAIRLLVILNKKAIKSIVVGAVKGQEFIKSITRDFSHNSKNSMFWLSPFFNIPIIQHTTAKKVHRYKTALGYLRFKINTDILDKKKQSSSIAPNLIHSLDATLMFLTVEDMIKSDVANFQLIHDCYYTDCNNIDIMNKSIRKSYFLLFNNNPLQEWLEQINTLYDTHKKASDIMINTLVLDDVLKSNYLFS